MADTDQKLDRVLMLLEGAGQDAPGLLHKVNTHADILLGKDGSRGMVQKVDLMWRAHIWLLCTLSGGLGFLCKPAFDAFKELLKAALK